MTREEEINNASYAYWVNNYANIEFIDEEEKELHTQDIQESFINGAEWADQHPHWISVKDKLPPLRQGVLAYNGVTMYIAWVSDDFVWRTHKEHCFRMYPVTHWMPLPQPPKEGGAL